MFNKIFCFQYQANSKGFTPTYTGEIQKSLNFDWNLWKHACTSRQDKVFVTPRRDLAETEAERLANHLLKHSNYTQGSCSLLFRASMFIRKNERVRGW